MYEIFPVNNNCVCKQKFINVDGICTEYVGVDLTWEKLSVMTEILLTELGARRNAQLRSITGA